MFAVLPVNMPVDDVIDVTVVWNRGMLAPDSVDVIALVGGTDVRWITAGKQIGCA